jgi:phosphinothricin acetyltransferase
MTGYAQPLPHALRGEMEGAGCSSALKFAGVHSVIGGIALPNDASVRLHEKFGFKKVAHFREVGFKSNRWIDVAYWQLNL